MTEKAYPQIKIIPSRFLNPETLERLLNLLFIDREIEIKRVVLHGQSIPERVPYGPARGAENDNSMRRDIELLGNTYQLQVHVGAIILELEKEEYVEPIRVICEEVFEEKFPFSIMEGIFMRSDTMTTTDYAKYGKLEDDRILGLSDPKSKRIPIIIQDAK